MKKTTEQYILTYRILNTAKLTEMDKEGKFAVIRLMKALKKFATDYDDFVSMSVDKLKIEGIEKIALKEQKKEPLTEKEKQLYAKFNADVNACVQKELKKEVEVEAELLSEEAFQDFVSSNDFALGDIMFLSDIIVK